MSSLSNEELKHYESDDDEVFQLNPGDESQCEGNDCPCLNDEVTNTTRSVRRVINNKEESNYGWCDAAIAAQKNMQKCDACGWLMFGRSPYSFGPFNNYCHFCGEEIDVDQLFGEVFDTPCKLLAVFGFDSKTGKADAKWHSECSMAHINPDEVPIKPNLLRPHHTWTYGNPGKLYYLFKALERGRTFPDEVTKRRVATLVQEFVARFTQAVMANKVGKMNWKRERALLRYNEAQSKRATRKRAITTFLPVTAALSDQDFDAMFPAKIARIKDEAHRIEIDTITAIPPDQLTPGDIAEFVKFISQK